MAYRHLFDLESECVRGILRQMDFAADRLQGQSAIVTGAARGIGEQTARGLASLGASVLIVDILEQGQQVADEIVAAGGQALFFQGDLAVAENVYQSCDFANRSFGKVDILVNNAVNFDIYSVLEMSLEQWDHSQHVNLRSAFPLCQAPAAANG